MRTDMRVDMRVDMRTDMRVDMRVDVLVIMNDTLPQQKRNVAGTRSESPRREVYSSDEH